jgi:hypothetical protein
MISKKKRQFLIEKRKEMMQENMMIADLIKQPPDSRKVNQCKIISHYLSKINFFTGLDSDKLIEIGKRAYFQEFPPEFTIFKEGEIGKEMFLILSGSV